ncbi:MAG: pyrroline-5-carboxylate reductase [Anaerolineaceae bacterium]|nr:pyrroline-5-carboxylate reductase [Anaerolineaceae bacterium]
MGKDFKISLIGSGVMGEAFLAGLFRNQIALAEFVTASDIRPEKLNEIQSRYGVNTTQDNRLAVKEAEVIILAVKPQNIDSVCESMDGKIMKDALVISIVAGVKISQIRKSLSHDNIVRVMPNTPAQIGEGISVWTASKSVNTEQIERARVILGGLGEEIFVEDENYLDMATALSGSGPAYAFLFMEAMVDAGVHLGFPRHISEKLVTHTVKGSVNYYMHKEGHPASLRNEVTSPGGTSAEAIYYLEKAGFRTAISRAVWAAFERSKSLGRGKKSQTPE